MALIPANNSTVCLSMADLAFYISLFVKLSFQDAAKFPWAIPISRWLECADSMLVGQLFCTFVSDLNSPKQPARRTACRLTEGWP
jgi:hypothetical protein